MAYDTPDTMRHQIDRDTYADADAVIDGLVRTADLSADARAAISAKASSSTCR